MLTATHHAMIDRAADLVPERHRGVFLGHVRAALAAEYQLSDRRFKRVLCDVLSRFGVAVRISFFEQQNVRGRKPDAATSAVAVAERAAGS
jgi:hypothetical protein